jgi:shikimate 5-dehydrogenase
MQAIEVEFAVTEDKKLRGQLRDVAGIESQITALQIAALKRVSKSTKVLVLDKNGSTARSVAKDLARKGYGNVFVIDGAFLATDVFRPPNLINCLKGSIICP